MTNYLSVILLACLMSSFVQTGYGWSESNLEKRLLDSLVSRLDEMDNESPEQSDQEQLSLQQQHTDNRTSAPSQTASTAVPESGRLLFARRVNGKIHYFLNCHPPCKLGRCTSYLASFRRYIVCGYCLTQCSILSKLSLV